MRYSTNRQRDYKNRPIISDEEYEYAMKVVSSREFYKADLMGRMLEEDMISSLSPDQMNDLFDYLVSCGLVPQNFIESETNQMITDFIVTTEEDACAAHAESVYEDRMFR
jgi:hypothetical protein